MKILTLCAGGNTRSVTLATILKYQCRGKYDVLAASIEKNSDSTLRMLINWAEVVIVVDQDLLKEMCHRFHDECRGKIQLLNIGQDVWGMSMHPDLVPLACKLLSDAGFELKKSAEDIVKYRDKYEARREASKEQS